MADPCGTKDKSFQSAFVTHVSWKIYDEILSLSCHLNTSRFYKMKLRQSYQAKKKERPKEVTFHSLCFLYFVNTALLA